MSVEQFVQAPPAESCRLVPFDKYQIVETNPPVLYVSGVAPCLNMKVRLEPVVYVTCPEYWRIEVVGCLPGCICITAVQPYTVKISLAGIIGSKGIEIAGANGTRQIDLQGGCKDSTTFNCSVKE